MALTQVAGGMIASGQSIASPTFTGTSTFAGGVANAYGFGVGTAVPSSGAGITFPATQSASSNANTLDDYEEGTWTFGVSFGGGTTGITYSETAGSYTRVGNMVNIRGYCELTSKGSSSGAAQVTGLPFVCSSATNAHTSCGIALNNVSFNAWPMCWIGPTTALGNIYQSTTAGALSAIQNTNFNNTSWIMISCSYYTTA